MTTPNVAIVGMGVGEQHARAFHADPRCHVIGLCDIDRARAQRLADTLGVPTVFDSFDDIAGRPDIDIVSLASFDQDHYEQVVEALQAKKHVFVEKPLCRSNTELNTIERAWITADRPALVSNLVLREAPLWRWLDEAISDGLLGEIYAVDGEYLYGRIHKITEGWRATVDDYSVFEGGAIHILDLVLTLTRQRPTKVRAQGNRIATSDTPFRYNDYVTATYEFNSGLLVRVTSNFSCVHRHHHVLRVYGTEGTFIYDDAGARLHTSRDESQNAAPIEFDPLPSSKGVLIPRFLDLVDSPSEKRVAAAEREFSLMRACLAAVDSERKETSVSIEYER